MGYVYKFKCRCSVIKQNDVAKEFYIILSGKYEINFKNGKSITLDKQGDFIGWATIIAAPIYLGTGVALTDGEALKLSRQDFMDLLISDSEIGNKIMANGSKIASKKVFTS
jgi:CRP-like cAMP-binding protein